MQTGTHTPVVSPPIFEVFVPSSTHMHTHKPIIYKHSQLNIHLNDSKGHLVAKYKLV